MDDRNNNHASKLTKYKISYLFISTNSRNLQCLSDKFDFFFLCSDEI